MKRLLHLAHFVFAAYPLYNAAGTPVCAHEREQLWIAGFVHCSSHERAPFLPKSVGAWETFAKRDDLFVYNGAGVQPKRVWVIAPDAQLLKERWNLLTNSSAEEKQDLFQPTLRNGLPADRHIHSVVRQGLAGFPVNLTALAFEKRPCNEPVIYGFRSFKRQWIIPDSLVITQPNARLWSSYSNRQVYLTALMAHSPSSGPALTFTGLVPDKHHYKGSFAGRVFPLWSDAAATVPNVQPGLIDYLAEALDQPISAEDVMAYIAAIAAHPGYLVCFQEDLTTGLIQSISTSWALADASPSPAAP